jgi:hypothetical protein
MAEPGEILELHLDHVRENWAQAVGSLSLTEMARDLYEAEKANTEDTISMLNASLAEASLAIWRHPDFTLPESLGWYLALEVAKDLPLTHNSPAELPFDLQACAHEQIATISSLVRMFERPEVPILTHYRAEFSSGFEFAVTSGAGVVLPSDSSEPVRVGVRAAKHKTASLDIEPSEFVDIITTPQELRAARDEAGKDVPLRMAGTEIVAAYLAEYMGDFSKLTLHQQYLIKHLYAAAQTSGYDLRALDPIFETWYRVTRPQEVKEAASTIGRQPGSNYRIAKDPVLKALGVTLTEVLVASGQF